MASEDAVGIGEEGEVMKRKRPFSKHGISEFAIWLETVTPKFDEKILEDIRATDRWLRPKKRRRKKAKCKKIRQPKIQMGILKVKNPDENSENHFRRLFPKMTIEQVKEARDCVNAMKRMNKRIDKAKIASKFLRKRVFEAYEKKNQISRRTRQDHPK